jgi:hypothetical protein
MALSRDSRLRVFGTRAATVPWQLLVLRGP